MRTGARKAGGVIAPRLWTGGMYTIHFVVWFGDMDTSAGRSTEAQGLPPHVFPMYDPRNTLA